VYIVLLFCGAGTVGEVEPSMSDVTVCKVMCTVACKVVLYDG
jgi:hypothetical protein